MKTFAYYRDKLLYASPMVKEMYLAEAMRSGRFDADQMDRLVEIASADAP